jgi:hypothetical protein
MPDPHRLHGPFVQNLGAERVNGSYGGLFQMLQCRLDVSRLRGIRRVRAGVVEFFAQPQF